MHHRTILLIALLAILGGQLFGQCPNDTLFNPIPPAVSIQTDTLTDPMLPCYPYNCKVSFCHSWQFPQNFTGHIEITSQVGYALPINIQIWESCHYVRFDTCVIVGFGSTMFWDTVLALPSNAQLVICNSMQPVSVTIKPGPAIDTLGPPFLYIDTLCGVLIGTPELLTNSEFIYYELSKLYTNPVAVLAQDRKPNTAYLRRRRVDH